MNGPHDMGGMRCYGPVVAERDEPLFHGAWEKRALALTVAMGAAGMWTLDRMRFARESLPPVQYLSSTYYEIWLAALETMLVEKGLLAAAELDSGQASSPPVALNRPVADRQGMAAILARGGPVEREASRQPAFASGDRVVTSDTHPAGHTRLPRYARGKPGIIAAVQGCHVFPDSNAAGQGENPQWLYSVAFRAADLFGAGIHEVFLDCFEPYLSSEGT
ncbi:MAG: nitrile hydratase subunit beta [Nitratireductor sp.]|nr:nitrile hydratase subunit beta [Nitratireductor sp.]